MTLIWCRSVLAAVSVTASVTHAFAAVPTSGGSLTVNPTPVAAPPAPLAAPVAPPVRTASGDPLAGALSNGIASPLTSGPAVVCRPVRHVVHRRVVRHVVRPPVAVAFVAPPLVPLYPVVPYRPVYVVRPLVVYRPPVVVYRRPYPILVRPFFYGPRFVYGPYYRAG